MGVYSVNGFTTATASAANKAICALWNPSSTRRIKVLEVGVYRTGTTGTGPQLRRISVRGTPGSTVTPDGDNAWHDPDAPPSGALLDLAEYTVAPTFDTPNLYGAILTFGGAAGSGGSGEVWVMRGGLSVPPGAGLAVQNRLTEIWAASEVYYVWEEN